MRLLAATGLRPQDIIWLPRDCIVIEEYAAAITDQTPGAAGALQIIVKLRYFASKEPDCPADSLMERKIRIADALVPLVQKTVNEIRDATAHLSRAAAQRSTTKSFPIVGGGRIAEGEFLFLTIHRLRGELPLCVKEDEQIVKTSYATFVKRLGTHRQSPSLFQLYGKSKRVRSLSLRPYSLRHLMHTVLAEAQVSDVQVALHMNKKGAGSLDFYFHPTLKEKLQTVTLPPIARRIFVPASHEETVAKLVVGGFAGGTPIERTFKELQVSHGDEHAFRYLCATAGGFHTTPLGFCVNSFAMNPCPKHLRCFHGCSCYVPSGEPSHTISLQNVRDKLRQARELAIASPKATLGRKNQISEVPPEFRLPTVAG